MKKRSILITGIPLALLLLIGIAIQVTGIKPIFLGAHDPVCAESGIALNGYDPLTYQVSPQKGSEAHSYEWQGATWYFTSSENLETFKASPEKYCPAYGGHCSFAVSTGFAVPGNPESYAFVDDTLYFFSEEKVKETYLADFVEYKSKSNSKWNH